MVLIGFALIAVAAVIGIDITAQNNFAVEIDAFGRLLSTTASGVFVAGIVTGLAAAIGIMLFRDGLVRSRRASGWPRPTPASTASTGATATMETST